MLRFGLKKLLLVKAQHLINKNEKTLKQAIFVIGVSGCGKSTIGKLLADEMNIPFFDGDDFHSKENIAKMSSGKSLNDYDRHSWLVKLNQLAKKQLKNNSCVIVVRL